MLAAVLCHLCQLHCLSLLCCVICVNYIVLSLLCCVICVNHIACLSSVVSFVSITLFISPLLCHLCQSHCLSLLCGGFGILIFAQGVCFSTGEAGCEQHRACTAQGMYSTGCVHHRVCTAQGVYSTGCEQHRVCFSTGYVQHRVCTAQGVYSTGRVQHRACTAQGVYSTGRVQHRVCSA